jgi:hypothetical protein
VTGVNVKAQTLNLQNPWGYAHQPKLSIKDFKQLFGALCVGSEQ